LDIRFSRSGGPGGQNVNKRDTRVEIVFDLDASEALSPAMKDRARQRLGARVDARGRIHVTSSAGRTQGENRRRALERFAALLEEALRPPPRPRRPTKPSKAAREARLEAKRRQAARKGLRKQVRSEPD
jgi:ribosome-associated protein